VLNPAEAPFAAGIAVKITAVLLSGAPDASLTRTWSGVVNGVITIELCGEPPITVKLPGGISRLTSKNDPERFVPVTDAVTL
jgi:hypothetical protein